VIPTLDELRAAHVAQQPTWPDAAACDAVVDRLRRQPPLVFAGECDALRDRLAAVADLRLEQRHSVRLGDPGADELLGPELNAVLSGPPRRLSRDEIDRCVTRIEEL